MRNAIVLALLLAAWSVEAAPVPAWLIRTLRPKATAYRVTEWTELSKERRGARVFRLVKACGPSRAGGSTYCGAGTECDLVWVESEGTRVRSVRTFLIASCFKNVEPAESCMIESRNLTCEYGRQANGETESLRLVYSLDQPQDAPVETRR